jgi:cytochrome c55X
MLLAVNKERKRLALVCSVLFCLIVAACTEDALVPQSAISPERQVALDHLIKHDCGSCHGMTRKGGLGSPLIASELAQREDEALVAIILEGIAGTPMPPWKALLSEEEVLWIVGRLKEGKGNED